MSDIAEIIKKSIKEEGKITCKDALKIANEAGVSPSEVGKEINNMKIKIKGCQLGCF